MSDNTIVIGAGLNGLAAAAYLARAGRRVIVLERRATIGGSAVTAEFAPGFRCDIARHDIGWIQPRLVRDLALDRHGLRLVATGRPVLAPDGNNAVLALGASPSATVDAIRRYSAADAARWPAFVERTSNLAGFLARLYAGPAPTVPPSSAGDLIAALRLGLTLRALGRKEMVALLRTVPMSVAELLDDEFETGVLKGALGARGITHLCQGPRAGGTAFVFLHHQVGRGTGDFSPSVVPVGGVGAVAAAIAGAARAAGAEIRCDASVARALTHDGAVTGVVLESGEEIGAAQVLSSADPRHTFLELCDPARLEPEFVRAVRSIRFRGAWAKVNLALDTLPSLTGATAEQLRESNGVVISPDLDYLERAYDAAKYGRVSDAPYLDVRIPSLRDASFAPPGKHAMSIHVQYAPYHLREGAWDDRARDALGDRVMATLARHFPSLPDAVLHRQVLTPLDLERDFGLPEGNAYHGELTLDQVLFMRPVYGWSAYRTPVRGLYLCGSGAHPGGGIAGGAGANAANLVIAEGG